MAISKLLLAGDPAHLRAAFGDLGLKEIPGKGHHPRIVSMFAKSGNPQVVDDETAWCSAAIGAWLAESGNKGTGSLAARSYLQWGTPTDQPKRGDIAVFKRGKPSWQGHVGIYLGRDKGRVTVIGGNQSNAVTVASYPEADLIAYRRVPAAAPSPIPKPKEAPVAMSPILKPGATGAGVTILQRNLAAAGFDPGPVDGEFGPTTTKAVKAFQLKHGLDPDGEVGPLTSAMLALKLKPAVPKPTAVKPIPTSTLGNPPAEPVGGDEDGLGGARVVLTVLGILALALGALAYLVWG
jgi:uncharacterized protein (TIGR02594 family)